MNALLVLAALLAALAILGLAYQWAGERRDARRYPPPGEVLGGLHVHSRGSGRPAIVLEAGIAASSASWKLVAEPLSGEALVVAYDRAGFGWSEERPAPRTIPRLVEDLREMLDRAGIREPVILVGHSFGGLLLRHFAAAHPARVAGLVLADPLLPGEWHPIDPTQAKRLGRGVSLSRRGATLARLGVVRLALDLLLSGSILLPKLLAKASSGRGSAVTDRIVGEVRKLPPEIWPVMRAHWCLPRSFRVMAEYLARLPENCAFPVDDSALRDLPLVVISAGSAGPAILEGHRALAAQSSCGRHVVAEGSGHWVQLDRPDIIVEEALGMMARR